jgi:hypothetical protein
MVIKMKLILELSGDTVKQWNAGLYSESYEHLTRILKKNGVVFDNKINDPSSPLLKFLIVDIKSKDQGHLILEELTKHNSILSGYIKPADESPLR